MDDTIFCPRCKTTKYRNPSLVLMVNECGHALCENCVELLFVRGSGECPQCKMPLRRSKFRRQMFEDPVVEKEVDIRRSILRDFNRKEDSFPSLKEYNDYLEMVETIVFNLTNGIDVKETEKRIEAYKRENQEQIRKNRSKMSRDEEELEELILQEAADREEARVHAAQEQAQEKREKMRNKEALIDELMFSDQSAARIVENHRREIAQQQTEVISQIPKARHSTFSTGVRVGKQETLFMPLPQDLGEPYVHERLMTDIMGPAPPTWEEIHNHGFLENIRPASEQDQGGGYISDLGVSRAISEAYCGLFFSFDRLQLSTELNTSQHKMMDTS